MKNVSLNTIKSPSLIGIGLTLCIGYYSLKDWQSEIQLDPVADRQIVATLAHPWFDKAQDFSVSNIEAILKERLRNKDKHHARKLASHISTTAQKYNIAPSLVLALIQSESSFRFDAKSNWNAIGLMQLRPSTAKYLAEKWKIKSYKNGRDLYNPYTNITMGIAYMAYLRSRFNNPTHFIAAYNLGPTCVGRMLDENNFRLGKVTKYVSEINAQAGEFHQQAKLVVAQN